MAGNSQSGSARAFYMAFWALSMMIDQRMALSVLTEWPQVLQSGQHRIPGYTLEVAI